MSTVGRFLIKKKMTVLILEDKLGKISLKISNFPQDEDIFELERIKRELGVIRLNKIRGSQVRCRLKWVEEGERYSAYFLGLEKKGLSKIPLFH